MKLVTNNHTETVSDLLKIISVSILIILLTFLFSCESIDEDIRVVEPVRYFNDFDKVEESVAYINYNDWIIEVHLNDSVHIKSDIDSLFKHLDEIETILPSRFLELSKRICKMELRNNNHWGQFIPNVDTSTIVLKPPYNLSVILHEIGHLRKGRTYYFSNGYSATNAIDLYEEQKELWEGQYASESHNEYFAELFKFYYLNPSYLKEKDSVSYNFIEKVLTQPLN